MVMEAPLAYMSVTLLHLVFVRCICICIKLGFKRFDFSHCIRDDIHEATRKGPASQSHDGHIRGSELGIECYRRWLVVASFLYIDLHYVSRLLL